MLGGYSRQQCVQMLRLAKARQVPVPRPNAGRILGRDMPSKGWRDGRTTWNQCWTGSRSTWCLARVTRAVTPAHVRLASCARTS